MRTEGSAKLKKTKKQKKIALTVNGRLYDLEIGTGPVR